MVDTIETNHDILKIPGGTICFIFHCDLIFNISHCLILNLCKICKNMIYNMTIFGEKYENPKFSAKFSFSAVFWGAIPEKLTKFKKKN